MEAPAFEIKNCWGEWRKGGSFSFLHEFERLKFEFVFLTKQKTVFFFFTVVRVWGVRGRQCNGPFSVSSGDHIPYERVWKTSQNTEIFFFYAMKLIFQIMYIVFVDEKVKTLIISCSYKLYMFWLEFKICCADYKFSVILSWFMRIIVLLKEMHVLIRTWDLLYKSCALCHQMMPLGTIVS